MLSSVKYLVLLPSVQVLLISHETFSLTDGRPKVHKSIPILKSIFSSDSFTTRHHVLKQCNALLWTLRIVLEENSNIGICCTYIVWNRINAYKKGRQNTSVIKMWVYTHMYVCIYLHTYLITSKTFPWYLGYLLLSLTKGIWRREGQVVCFLFSFIIPS